MCEGKSLFPLVVVIILSVYILRTVLFVTSFRVTNSERTVVQHPLCISEIFLLILISYTYHCRYSGLLLHLGTVNDPHTHTHNR